MTKINGNTPISQSQTTTGNPAPRLQEGDTVHVVQRGETLGRIASQNRIPLNELVNANPQIQNPNRIEVGDQVRIPTMSVDPSVQNNLSQNFMSNSFSSNEANMSMDTSLRAPQTPAQETPRNPTPSEGRADGRETTEIDDRIGQGVTILSEVFGSSAYSGMDEAVVAAGGKASTLSRVMGPLGIAVDAGTAGYNQFENANTNTALGTGLQTSLVTVSGGLYGVQHPGAALVDAALGSVGLPTLSGTAYEGVNQLTTIGEALATGDVSNLERLNQDNLSGENGGIFQVAAGYGEAITNQNTSHLENYQNRALQGEYGQPARVFAETGDFWAENNVGDVGGELADGVGYLASEAWNSMTGIFD